MRQVYIDTGGFYALADKADRHHADAVKVARRIEKLHLAVFTTEFVIAEAHVLILSRLGHHVARRWLGNLNVRLEHVSRDDFEKAKDLITRHKDQDYSLTDAVSMVILHRTGTEDVFGFDSHFTAMGFALFCC